MPEWLVERGIGETRAALVEEGEIIEARIAREGIVPTGSVLRARLVHGGVNGRNAIAVGDDGVEYMLPQGASGVTQGATLAVEVTRETIPGSESWKLSLARVTDKTPAVAPELTGRELVFPAPCDVLGEVGWEDLLDQARTGMLNFTGGELRISPTPAMTLIDVDGYLPPEELAVIGAAQAARAIRRFDIGGSIGLDLPTGRSKATRQSTAQAVDAVLPQPFERTAVNGFGFLQIVRPRPRPSLMELAQERAPFEARALLRRAAFEPAGSKRLVAHPAVIAVLQAKRGWTEELSRQVGGSVVLLPDASLAMSGGHAEKA